MAKTAERLRSEVAHEVSRLGPKELAELRDFAAFLGRKAVMERIDPDQAWFWTRRWQAAEREAETDLRRGRTRKFGSMRELVTARKR